MFTIYYNNNRNGGFPSLTDDGYNGRESLLAIQGLISSSDRSTKQQNGCYNENKRHQFTMNMTLINSITQFTEKPRTLFLLDSMGAALTAFLLYVVVRNNAVHFGVSEQVLTYLSLIAVLFCVYSAGCYLFLQRHWSRFLSIIAIANLLYCVLTLTLVCWNWKALTWMGIAYFSSESLIILSLVYIELKVVKALLRTQQTR